MPKFRVRYTPYRDVHYFADATRTAYFEGVPTEELAHAVIFFDPDVGRWLATNAMVAASMRDASACPPRGHKWHGGSLRACPKKSSMFAARRKDAHSAARSGTLTNADRRGAYQAKRSLGEVLDSLDSDVADSVAGHQ